MCPYQRCLLSFRMRSRSSMPSRASSSVDLMLAVSCGLTLHLSDASDHYSVISLQTLRLGIVHGQVSLAWSIALRTLELYTRPRVLKERLPEERTGISSLNFFQAVLWSKVHNHQLLRACLPSSKRKLPPPACQAQLELPSCGLPSKGCAVPWHRVHL